MKNRRPLFFMLLLAFLIFLICASLYTLTRPTVIKRSVIATNTQIAIDSQISTATQEEGLRLGRTATEQSQFATQEAIATKDEELRIGQTATAQSDAATLTQVAQSNAATLTQIALPPTFTPVATKSLCSATLTKDGYLYSVPADSIQLFKITRETPIDVIGQLNDGWYQVTTNGVTGWIPNNSAKLLSSCQIGETSLAASLSLPGKTLIDETFVFTGGWTYVNPSNKTLQRVPDPDLGDYRLIIDDGYSNEASVTNPILQELGSFDLAMAYDRQNSGNQSYVGVRFGNQSSSYSVKIDGNCNINVEVSNSNPIEPQKTLPNKNTCSDKTTDLLFVGWNGQDVQIRVNDDETVYKFPLGSNFSSTGTLELIFNGVKAQIRFVTATQP